MYEESLVSTIFGHVRISKRLFTLYIYLTTIIKLIFSIYVLYEAFKIAIVQFRIHFGVLVNVKSKFHNQIFINILFSFLSIRKYIYNFLYQIFYKILSLISLISSKQFATFLSKKYSFISLPLNYLIGFQH